MRGYRVHRNYPTRGHRHPAAPTGLWTKSPVSSGQKHHHRLRRPGRGVVAPIVMPRASAGPRGSLGGLFTLRILRSRRKEGVLHDYPRVVITSRAHRQHTAQAPRLAVEPCERLTTVGGRRPPSLLDLRAAAIESRASPLFFLPRNYPKRERRSCARLKSRVRRAGVHIDPTDDTQPGPPRPDSDRIRLCAVNPPGPAASAKTETPPKQEAPRCCNKRFGSGVNNARFPSVSVQQRTKTCVQYKVHVQEEQVSRRSS